MKKSLILLSMVLMALLVTACGSDKPGAIAAPNEPGIELTDTLLANLEYKTIFTKSGTAQFNDGSYSESAEPGSASDSTLKLTEFVARGRVSDVDNAAAVVLAASPGGSGSFYELALVIQHNGQPKNVSSYLLGDRVRINAVTIEDGAILVDMYTQGPQDPMCCPTQHVVNTYNLNVNELILTHSQAIESNTSTVPVELTGSTWQWSSLYLVDSEGETSTQEIQDPARYSLSFAPNETINYQADCVQASGTYSTEGELIHLDLGQPPAPECQGDSHAREFQQYLISVISFRIEADNLILKLDSGEGHMVLASGEPLAAAPTITISSPAPTSQVNPDQLLFVSGSASGLYEAGLAVRVLDENGDLLAEEPLTLQGENASIGAAGTWSVALSLENVSSSMGQIVAYATNSQDDTWIAQATLPVQFIH
jgi:hypothetical protein